MKKIISVVACMLLLCLQSQAQNYNSFFDKLQKMYNQKSFAAIYNELLSDDFKSQLSESDWQNFLEINLYPSTGNIDSIVTDASGQNIAYCEKMKLTIQVLLNSDNKAEGIAFNPYSQSKKTSYHSSNSQQSELDQFVELNMKSFYETNTHAQISIAFIDNGQIHFYHYAPEKFSVPDFNSMYEIGSITKTFTGLLIAQAVIEKKLTVEDDIRKYLPTDLASLEYEGQPIRIRHLLTHTSGLPRLPKNYMDNSHFDSDNPYHFYSENQLFDALKSTTLESSPGTRYEYSNLGYGLLGYILMKVYDKDLDIIFKEKYSEIFNLNAVTFLTNPNMLLGHDEVYKSVPHWDFDSETGLAAAGGIKSNIADMADYIALQLRTDVPAVTLSHHIFSDVPSQSMAYSWIVETLDNGQNLYWHNGATAGFSSFSCFTPHHKRGFVILNNSAHNLDKLAINMVSYLFKSEE